MSTAASDGGVIGTDAITGALSTDMAGVSLVWVGPAGGIAASDRMVFSGMLTARLKDVSQIGSIQRMISKSSVMNILGVNPTVGSPLELNHGMDGQTAAEKSGSSSEIAT